jgi:hypothetical protein
MRKEGAPTSSEHLDNTMTVDPITDAHHSTYLDDESIESVTYMISPHLDGVPCAYVITLLTFSPAAYGLTLLANRQYRWTRNLPATTIPIYMPDSLTKLLYSSRCLESPAPTSTSLPMPRTPSLSKTTNFKDSQNYQPLTSSVQLPS